MAVDINHTFGYDIQVNGSGDLDAVDGIVKSEQRVLRRLLTAIKGYYFHTDYGAGIPEQVGKSLSFTRFEKIKAVITSNIFLESTVVKKPTPQIFLQKIPNGLFCQISYIYQPTNEPITLTFNINF